ncbi:MAG: glutathione S-transferase family protein [Pseudohongiella sp.]|nr:glutathione S-transferase family protein [Pseudohongiella sp.]
MFTLFIANKNYSSWSLRPWVLMRELGITFEEDLVPFGDGSSWELFRAFSPSGKVPCLMDNGTAVWDSMGITEYLAERREGIWPSDERARAWARCAAAEMHSGFSALRDICGMSVGVRVALHTISPALKKDIDRLEELWSEGLALFGGPYLAGGVFSAVDAFFAPVAFRIQSYGLQMSPASMAYAGLLLNLDSMKEWERDALAEPWRDASHEVGVPDIGRVIADLRQ